MSSAPYRFVPIDKRVVCPPVEFADLDLSKPRDGCVSGEIAVTWRAETSVCVGEAVTPDGGGGSRQDETREVAPIRLGGRYCLPGPSLRGMVRSIVEIATHSHLGRINHWRQHGIRSFNRKEMPAGHAFEPDGVKAGWLTYHGDEGWRVSPTSYRLVEIAELSRVRTEDFRAWVNLVDWGALTSLQKYERLAAATSHQTEGLLLDKVAMLGCTSTIEFPRRQPDGTFANVKKQVPAYRFPVNDAECDPDFTTSVTLVMTGGGDNRRFEVAFSEPSGHPFIVPKPTMDLFMRLHGSHQRRTGDCVPLDNPMRPWRYWLCRTGIFDRLGFTNRRTRQDPDESGLDERIPVFYVGTPGQPDFFFSLSRVVRLPWKHDVGQVAQHLYDDTPSGRKYRVPRLPSRERDAAGNVKEDPDASAGWDFARAMFGWVEDRDHDGPRTTNDTTARALAGRVAFGFAWSDATADVPQMPTASGVLGAPRESFYPFYLTRKDPKPGETTGATYDDEYAIPAGRKRYVVRETITGGNLALPQPSEPQSGEPPARVSSTVHFLPTGTTFEGTIRFQNLHPTELGALLWALTFGEPDHTKRKHRHQIGRARAHGAGVLSASVVLAKTVVHGTIPSGTAGTVVGYIRAFRDHMATALGLSASQRLEDTPSVRALLATAHPAVGRMAADRGQLANMPLEPPNRPGTYSNLKRAFDEDRAKGRPIHNRLPKLPDA